MQRVRRLQGLDRRDGLGPAKLADVEVGYADMAQHTLPLQLGEGRPALFDLLVGDRPVDLVEVDRVHPQTGETSLHLSQERVASQAVDRGPPRALGLSTLGEHVRAPLESGQRAPDNLFGVPEAILCGRVDPVHAEFERMVDRRDRFFVVLRSPAPVVAGAPDGPSAEADAGDLEARRPKLCSCERGRHDGVSFPTERAQSSCGHRYLWNPLKIESPVGAVVEHSGVALSNPREALAGAMAGAWVS